MSAPEKLLIKAHKFLGLVSGEVCNTLLIAFTPTDYIRQDIHDQALSERDARIAELEAFKAATLKLSNTTGSRLDKLKAIRENSDISLSDAFNAIIADEESKTKATIAQLKTALNEAAETVEGILGLDFIPCSSQAVPVLREEANKYRAMANGETPKGYPMHYKIVPEVATDEIKMAIAKTHFFDISEIANAYHKYQAALSAAPSTEHLVIVPKALIRNALELIEALHSEPVHLPRTNFHKNLVQELTAALESK